MQSNNFVTTEWLVARLGEPALTIMDGSFFLPAQNRNARSEYLAGHIPTAVFFDIDEIADRSTSLPHMLPGEKQFGHQLGELGVSDEDTIVVYDSAGMSGAPRVWWTLKVFGARKVHVLDGGLPKWQAEGRALETGVPSRKPARFNARLRANAVATAEDVRAALSGRTAQVVDARSAGRFAGCEAEPRPGLRGGHMPGAKSVPVTGLVENGRLIDPERIKAAFSAGEVDVDQPVITTCGSGVTAATLWLALDCIGRPPRALYDGSWTEWGQRHDLPVERS